MYAPVFFSGGVSSFSFDNTGAVLDKSELSVNSVAALVSFRTLSSWLLRLKQY